MAAPVANVNATEIITLSEAPKDQKKMTDTDPKDPAAGAQADALTGGDAPAESSSAVNAEDQDLVAEALDTAAREADAVQAAKRTEDHLREVSPAVSEGSADGEVGASGQNGSAAVNEVEKAASSSAAGSAGSKKIKKKEDKGIGDWKLNQNATEEGKEMQFACEKVEKDVEHCDPEHILKALNSLETPEEKLAALCKKYADLHEEHRGMKLKFKQSQHKLTGTLREKDHLQTEHSKAILAKSKLESLCRELQRHNKLIKDESYARAREEEEKRKEVTNKFQQTINDIQQQMNDHYTKNGKLREENVDLANKLKTLIEQYEQREQHIEKVLKHKDLEQQLVDARLQQANLKIAEEKERSDHEKQFLLTEAAEANKKVQLFEEQEKALRAQVGLYTEKYEEFQTTLSKSNEVFSTFKVEMDKMTKKIKKLEKETHMWKQRWENSNRALAQMADEKTTNDQQNALLQSKVKKLESLCRALQQERNKTPSSTEPGEAAVSSEAGAESPAVDTPAAGAPEPPSSTPDTEAGAAHSPPSQQGEPPAAPESAVAPSSGETAQQAADVATSTPSGETQENQAAQGENGAEPNPQPTETVD